jgi:hypothetical protein
MLGWLTKTAARWSVCVVQDGYLVVAVADLNQGAASLELLLPMFERFGNPQKPYRLCVQFNPTRHIIWIDIASWSTGRLSPEFAFKLKKVDSKVLRRRGSGTAELQFFDPLTNGRLDERQLFARLWPASA